MIIDAQGICTAARQCPSPNHDGRSADIELVVIHHISLPPDCYAGDDVLKLFTNTLDPDADPYYADVAKLRVSSHFYIRRDGTLWQCVPTLARAWHAGVSNWRGRERCNDFSLGIELEGNLTDPFTDAQYRTLGPLLRALRVRHPGIREMTGHEHIAPGRKNDPGPTFDWDRAVRDSGLPLWRGGL